MNGHTFATVDGRSVCSRCGATSLQSEEWCSRRLNGRYAEIPPKFAALLAWKGKQLRPGAVATVVGGLAPEIVLVLIPGDLFPYAVGIWRVLPLDYEPAMNATPETLTQEADDDASFDPQTVRDY